MRSRRLLYSIGFLTVLLFATGVYIVYNHTFSFVNQKTPSTQMESQSANVTSTEDTQVVKQETQPAQPVQPVQPVQPAQTTISNHMLSNVPFIQQLPELERGCEVTSLAMLLQSAGISVDKITLAQEIPKVPFIDDEERGNPNDGFVGDIYTLDNSGYGVYHGPVYELTQQYLHERAVDLTGKDVKELYSYIDKGAPVWVITNTTFAPLNDDEFTTWETSNGDVTITYSEHSVVIVGYDDQYVYINDPLADGPKTAVPRQNFEQAWEQMGRQAISYTK